MTEALLAVLIPAGLLAATAAGYWLWARHGTDTPVEHHSTMPTEYQPPDG
ncbi:hypothetical protein [Kitasatospora sp. NPDC093806]